MFKRIETWLANIVRAELHRTETATMAEVRRLEGTLTLLLNDLKEHTESKAETLKAEIGEIKKHVSEEVGVGMVKRYDLIVDDAARAAHAAVHEARKTLRLACSLCGQLTWKFHISSVDKKPVCLDCEAKGKS